jgi:uncharacterized membrane protein YesL
MNARGVLLFAVSIVVGPAVAALVFAALGSVVASQVYGPRDTWFLIQYFPVVLLGAYFVGALPSIGFAVVMTLSSRFATTVRKRLMIAFALGLLSGLSVLALTILRPQDFALAASVVPAGGVSGLVCALIVEWATDWPHREQGGV